jgi:hypothetical protein
MSHCNTASFSKRQEYIAVAHSKFPEYEKSFNRLNWGHASGFTDPGERNDAI